MKPKFLPLKDLRDRVWPLANKEGLATDMTGVSLPILDFDVGKKLHPFQVKFLLYYAVPNERDHSLPDQITRPYAIATLDLQNGDLVSLKRIRTDDQPNPLIGPGTSNEIHRLVNNDRRNLQDFFFSRYDGIATIYPGRHLSADQIECINDLLILFEKFSEPPLASDYENFGKTFLKWLRKHAQSRLEN